MTVTQSYLSLLDADEKKGAITNSGDITFSSKRMNYTIGNYDLCILLDDLNRFIGVESIRVHKNFYDSKKLPVTAGRRVEDIVDEFFRDIEE